MPQNQSVRLLRGSLAWKCLPPRAPVVLMSLIARGTGVSKLRLEGSAAGGSVGVNWPTTEVTLARIASIATVAFIVCGAGFSVCLILYTDMIAIMSMHRGIFEMRCKVTRARIDLPFITALDLPYAVRSSNWKA